MCNKGGNPSIYNKLFDDDLVVRKIKQKLSHLFQLAELESQRNGKVGMEVGSTREKILIALLMYKFGLDDVNPDIPITEPETDVFVKNEPLSIKTITTPHGTLNGGVKVSWSVDAATAATFKNNYNPDCDMMLAKIHWDAQGQLYLFSKEAQKEILKKIGADSYLKLPTQGTNSRGVELTKDALDLLVAHSTTRKIDINFKREKLDYREVYTRWLDAWHEI
jgi:hypothetical protein